MTASIHPPQPLHQQKKKTKLKFANLVNTKKSALCLVVIAGWRTDWGGEWKPNERNTFKNIT